MIFDYGLFADLPKLVVACDFSLNSFKIKRGILPLLTKHDPNLKTTCHVKLKCFSSTKLLENLLLSKCLQYVAGTFSKLCHENSNITQNHLQKLGLRLQESCNNTLARKFNLSFKLC